MAEFGNQRINTCALRHDENDHSLYARLAGVWCERHRGQKQVTAIPDRKGAARTVTYIVPCAAPGVHDQAKAEMAALISLHGGYEGAEKGAEGLVEAGYGIDTEEAREYIAKQRAYREFREQQVGKNR